MIFFQFPRLTAVQCLFYGREKDPTGAELSFQMPGNLQAGKHAREKMSDFLFQYGCYAWCECHQVHKNDLLFEPEPINLTNWPGIYSEGDGLATSRPGLGLMIKTADCQPILMAHKSGRYIMALHIGWRGNRIDFIKKAVNEFCEFFRVKAEELLACRGPSLGPNNAEFVNFHKDWGEEFRPWFDENIQCMDLWGLTRHQLLKAGLLEENIYAIDICTYANDSSWFSWRKNKEAGRQAALIWIKNSCNDTEALEQVHSFRS